MNTAVVDDFIEQLNQLIIYAQAEYGPGAAGRIYACHHCGIFAATCAPLAELADDYSCIKCGQPQEALCPPLTRPGLPLRASRADRRARRPRSARSRR